ncbi:transglycosylase domain-containing protein [Streptomyces sp. 6N223]|uniref:transglycosylase domain-containing protein n=1 Tax=Streptomyces sp. 6N223 TaxID=3457412 RepID=UPI003FD39CED
MTDTPPSHPPARGRTRGLKRLRSALPRWPGWPSKSAGVPRPRRTGWRRFLPTWRMALAGSVVGAVVSAGAVLAGYLLVEIPQPKAIAAAQNNVYLYADGSQLARVGEVNREIIPLDRVPVPVRQAVLAAEDRDFYDSPEVDLTAMARAAWNMLRGGGTQSGSTITQQYVKNYYLDQEQTITRKVKELFIAVKLGQEASKDEILAGYLNTSYFGRDAYGVQAAAQAYYGKDAEELTTAEGAYLAALLAAPSVYDVYAGSGNRAAAVARWEYVLDGMVSEGWLGQARRDALRFPEPLPPRPADDLSGQRGYLVEAAREYLLSTGVVDERLLAAGGLKITTTFEPVRQQALVKAVEEQLRSSLAPGLREADGYVRAGASSVEADTGRVVAMYGGWGYTEQFVNNATRRDYQAASTFKPFVYAAALEHGARTREGKRVGPDTLYDGDSGREVVGRGGRGTGWSPENEGEKDFGEITVAEAMDDSVNAVFAQLGADVGPARVRDTAVALGIPDDTPGLDAAKGSIALGTATPSTLDLAQAYATLASHGVRHPAVLVEKVTLHGRELPLPEPRAERVISRRAADGTTAVLRGVVDRGTGMEARSAGRPAAGKTGTAEEDRAAWFAGYTPELATVVAVFGQDPATGAQRALYGAAGHERINGGGFPARIWGQYTARALVGLPVKGFQLDAPEARSREGREGEGEGDRDRRRPESSTPASARSEREGTPSPSPSPSSSSPSPSTPGSGPEPGPSGSAPVPSPPSSPPPADTPEATDTPELPFSPPPSFSAPPRTPPSGPAISPETREPETREPETRQPVAPPEPPEADANAPTPPFFPDSPTPGAGGGWAGGAPWREDGRAGA